MKLPLALSTTGHAAVLAALILYATRTGPPPAPVMKGAVAVVFSQPGTAAAVMPQPAATAPKPAPAKPVKPPMKPKPVEHSPPPAPPPVAAAPKPAPAKPVKPPVKPKPIENSPPPVPQPVAQLAPIPRPPRKPILRAPERRVVRRLRKPIFRQTEQRVMRRLYRPVVRQPPRPAIAEPAAEWAPAPSRAAGAGAPRYPVGARTAAAVSAPASVPGPDAAGRYVAMVRVWLERHKRYPDSARQHGEEGRVALRLRVDRFGDVLGYSVLASTGYGDLDAGVRDMMQGARLPPFPPGLTESEVDLTVTLRFSLTR